MKQRISLLLVALSAGILSAFAGEPEMIFLNVSNVEHVNIQDDMDVVLIQSQDDESSFILDKKTTESLDVVLENNTVYIAEKKNSIQQKKVIYLYVRDLKSLTVQGNSQVTTYGTLNTGKLDVFVGGNSQVHLRTTGGVKPHGLNDADIDVKYLTGPRAKRGF